MRITGYIEHPSMKITVFKMDNRLSVKFETGMYEQTFKFRESDEIAGFEDVQRIVDGAFMQAVLDNFSLLHSMKNEALQRGLPKATADKFEEII